MQLLWLRMGNQKPTKKCMLPKLFKKSKNQRGGKMSFEAILGFIGLICIIIYVIIGIYYSCKIKFGD